MSGEYMSYKQVAKWIKSKGRGKLRNYCTMCSRQFRDKKGLKNHMGSKMHLERMAEFNRNPEKFLQKFSDDFQRGFIEILVRMYGGKQVFARKVYTEYCHIMHHRHLNSTMWEDLDAFVEHLGKEKICEIEKGPKGYYIRYLGETTKEYHKKDGDEDINIDERDEKLRMKQMERNILMFQQKQKQKKLEEEKNNESFVGEEKKRESVEMKMKDEEKYKVMFVEEKKKKKIVTNALRSLSGKKRGREEKEGKDEKNPLEKPPRKIKKKNVWIEKGIVVKVLHKKLENGTYYKKKGLVVEVFRDSETAQIEIITSGETKGDIIQLHQKYLETVIPGFDRKVKILNPNDHAGKKGILKSIKKKEFCGIIKLKNGDEIKIPYEEFSKVL